MNRFWTWLKNLLKTESARKLEAEATKKALDQLKKLH